MTPMLHRVPADVPLSGPASNLKLTHLAYKCTRHIDLPRGDASFRAALKSDNAWPVVFLHHSSEIYMVEPVVEPSDLTSAVEASSWARRYNLALDGRRALSTSPLVMHSADHCLQPSSRLHSRSSSLHSTDYLCKGIHSSHLRKA